MARVVAVCCGLAALSLLLPSEPSYDPMAWLVWGREIASLELDTSGGPSWKPLPVAFTALTARLGELHSGLPMALWMLVARAGALLALVMAFRLASRLAGAGAAGALGGGLAATMLFLTPDWLQFVANGSEAPLAVALGFWAVERHLDGRADHALLLGFLACLLRPELVPFLGLYGVWAWRAHPALRVWLAAAALLIPLAWVVPEWIGSGDPLDGGAQARSEPVWSLSLAERPWLRALERVHNHAGVAVEVLMGVAIAGAVVHRRRAVLVLAGAALVEATMFVVMTEVGFSGNPRYVLPALALACVLAGIGAAYLVDAAETLPGRLAWRPLAVAALVALCAPLFDARSEHLRAEAHEVGVRMQIHRELARAVAAIGGRRAVNALGSATANRALHSRLAWELGSSMEVVESVTDHRVVFRSEREGLAGRVYLRGRAHVRETLLRNGTIWVYRRDGITLPFGERRLEAIGSPFTSSLQGLHRRASDGRNEDNRVVTR
jgi:hypothetical protein